MPVQNTTPATGYVKYEDGVRTIDFPIIPSTIEFKMGYAKAVPTVSLYGNNPSLSTGMDWVDAIGTISFETPNIKETREGLDYIKKSHQNYQSGTVTLTIYSGTELEKTYIMEQATMQNDVETTLDAASKYKVEFGGAQLKVQ